MSDKPTRVDSEKPAKSLRWLAHATGEGIVQWAVIKYGGYAVGLAVSILFAILAYDTGLSWYWLIFMTAMVLYFLVNVVNKIVGWFQRPKNENKEAEQIVGTEIEALEERIKELESESAALEKAREYASNLYEKAREDNDVLQSSLTAKINDLESHKWLHEIAKRDKSEIAKFVIVKDPAVNYEGLSAGAPYFVITFNVVNFSVHPISIDAKEVDGAIYRNDEEISGNLKMVSRIENLARGDEPMVLELKQWVSPQEIPLLINPLLDTVLRFNRLRITVKGGEGTSGIRPQKLKLPSEIQIKETQPPNLRVNELKDRIKELEREKKALEAANDRPKKRTVKEEPTLVCKRVFQAPVRWNGQTFMPEKQPQADCLYAAVAVLVNRPKAKGYVPTLPYLSAQLTFYDTEGEYHGRVGHAFWLGHDYCHYPLSAGGEALLVVAVGSKERGMFAANNCHAQNSRYDDEMPVEFEGEHFNVQAYLSDDNSELETLFFELSRDEKGLPLLKVAEGESA